MKPMKGMRRWWTAVRLAATSATFIATAWAQDASPKPAKPQDEASPAKTEAKSMAKPKVGEPAPEIKSKDHSGAIVTLAQFKGKKNVLLAFYPKSFTGG